MHVVPSSAGSTGSGAGEYPRFLQWHMREQKRPLARAVPRVIFSRTRVDRMVGR